MSRQDLLINTAIEAGKAIASIAPKKANVISKEGRGNYVTLADKTSEQIIFTRLREALHTDTVLSEETVPHLTEEKFLQEEHLWIIDPIDGTANYQHNRKYSCVSIGYAEKGELKLAVVYDPFREELFTAEKGSGAFRNGQRIKISEQQDIHNSTIITDNSYDPAIVREHLETFLKINPSPWILMKGSAALELCEVASGQADLFFSYCLKPWDNAAGFLIVQEAGGSIVNKEGKAVNFFSPAIIAGNPILIEEFLKVTK